MPASLTSAAHTPARSHTSELVSVPTVSCRPCPSCVASGSTARHALIVALLALRALGDSSPDMSLVEKERT